MSIASAEITPNAVKIDKLIQRMEDGDIKIPAFQRGFVWKQNQILELLDSIYNDYPIGSVLLWNSNDRLKSSRNIAGFDVPERPEAYPVNYVLDGQQRLSSIYGVFAKNRTRTAEADGYMPDLGIFDIFFDLQEEKFVGSADLDGSHSNFRASVLFDLGSFLDEVKKFPKHEGAAQKLLSKFQNYEIPVVTTSKRSKEEVGTIFERINNTGTKLSTFDLMIAWTWTEDFHLRESIDGILQNLDEKGFGDIDSKIVLQCLSAMVQKTTRTKDILGLSTQQVRDNVELLSGSLEKAVDFFATQLQMSSSDFLPQSHQVIPVTYFFAQIEIPTADQVALLQHWFWRTAFSLRYSGAIDTRLNQDLDLVDAIAKKEKISFDKYGQLPAEKTLIQTSFTRSNPFTRAFLILLAQQGPMNLLNASKIDVGVALSKYNGKEYHHIFPKAFLKAKGIREADFNSICNFCFLPADANKKISKRAPSDYFFSLMPPIYFDEIAASNLLPTDKSIYENDDFDRFRQARASLILNALKPLCGL